MIPEVGSLWWNLEYGNLIRITGFREVDSMIGFTDVTHDRNGHKESGGYYDTSFLRWNIAPPNLTKLLWIGE